MNIWKYLIAASLGNMIAGPLGALAFTAGAFFLGKKNNFRNPGVVLINNKELMQLDLLYYQLSLLKPMGESLLMR